MGEEIGTHHFTPRDFIEYRDRLARETETLAECLKEHKFTSDAPTGGYELEACLINAHGQPVPVNTQLLERLHNPNVVSELARFDVEINAPPRQLCANALSRMHQDLSTLRAQCNRAASDLDAELLFVGILPTLTDDQLTLERMSPQRRYRALNNQVFRVRRGQPIVLDIHGREHLRIVHHDVMLEAAATSFQIHLQVAPEQAARMYNTAVILSAPMVAISANSPYLFGHELWEETRIPLFEQSVDLAGDGTAPRVTLGESYVSHSLLECFRENVERHAVLLPIVNENEPPENFTHLRLHNGTIWRWNRPLVGFDAAGRPHLRIEHRVAPSGPSLADQMANAALFFGLMQSLGNDPIPLETQLPFSTARANFYAAARFGLQTEITWTNGHRVPARELLLDLLPRAREGLVAMELANEDIEHYLGIIEGRIRRNQTGAQWQRAYVERHGLDMAALTCQYREHQRADTPVHEWPL